MKLLPGGGVGVTVMEVESVAFTIIASDELELKFMGSSVFMA